MLPAAVIREAALRHNIAEMQAFAQRSGAHLCPHGKTTMSPEIFRMQLEAGAWGITAATAHHVRIYRRLGVSRVFLTNILAGRTDIDLITQEIAADPEFDFYCLVDSPEAASLLADGMARAGMARAGKGRRINLLVETGLTGARTGVRSVEAALALARQVAALPTLALRGVETFEGVRQAVPDARDLAGGMIDLAVAAVDAIAAEGLFADGPLLLSAGGSAFLDLCATRLPEEIGGRPVQRVIRPGCYVTHDSGFYERTTRPGGKPYPGLPDLRHALEVWGVVLSLPEPGRAIVGVGKRDASFDIEPPIPLWYHSSGATDPAQPADGMMVTVMWDQHLAIDAPPDVLAIGDLVGFGISHPCATFDRWTALLTVTDGYDVTGAVTTLF
ncbi:alanine racemase [Sphingosinicella sp. LHD-64]|uniref:alanine racemase n=1 Tax=Sphingosinicella sp. LHD-64 TaxID=3072139 RepID=UPI00280F9706|nr:alanine racemase [Sphingosinicella sp. LHD-64]MDQ8754672.1 alanine racemase [Sphingosinicella sp. LHD-64]